jgi:hypothetical protein
MPGVAGATRIEALGSRTGLARLGEEYESEQLLEELQNATSGDASASEMSIT